MIVRSTFFKLISTGILIFAIVVLILNFISYHQNRNDLGSRDDNNDYVLSNRDGDVLVRIKADVKSNSKPAILYAADEKNGVAKATIRYYMMPINHDQDQHVFVRETGESNFNILLLHGQSFSSMTWEKIGTLQYLASWGYKAYAIDLPGYGNSSLPAIQEEKSGQWLAKLIRSLRLSNVVIISPSMSGRFTLPYIIHFNNRQQVIRGFIPISPVGTDKFSINEYQLIQMPTLIVYGEHDTKFQQAVRILKEIPSSEVLMIKNASHACYLQQPLEFHNGLRQFLYKVYRPIYIEQYKKTSLLSTNEESLVSTKSDNGEKQTYAKVLNISTLNDKQKLTH